MAVALAAKRSTLTLYSLQPMARAGETITRNGQLQSQAKDFLVQVSGDSSSSSHCCLLKSQERHIFINGEVLLMEFLYPAVGDDQHVILLLVVSQSVTLLLIDSATDIFSGMTRHGCSSTSGTALKV